MRSTLFLSGCLISFFGGEFFDSLLKITEKITLEDNFFILHPTNTKSLDLNLNAKTVLYYFCFPTCFIPNVARQNACVGLNDARQKWDRNRERVRKKKKQSITASISYFVYFFCGELQKKIKTAAHMSAFRCGSIGVPHSGHTIYKASKSILFTRLN